MNNKSNNIEYRCPKCQRLLYSRRHKECGWCGVELPDELLFTKEEIAKLDEESAKLEEERRQRKIREEKEEDDKRSRGDSESW